MSALVSEVRKTKKPPVDIEEIERMEDEDPIAAFFDDAAEGSEDEVEDVENGTKRSDKLLRWPRSICKGNKVSPAVLKYALALQKIVCFQIMLLTTKNFRFLDMVCTAV